MKKAIITLVFFCTFIVANAAQAYVVTISETERRVCPDTVQGYIPVGNGQYQFISGAGGQYNDLRIAPNSDASIFMESGGCVRVSVTGYQPTSQCGTTRMVLDTGLTMTRSSCDTTPAAFNPLGGTTADARTPYTGAQVDMAALEAIWASWPASAKANCSAVLGCRSGNPMNVGTFHGKVREYKFDRDGMPTDGIAAGINLIRQWCQNEGRCTLMRVFEKYAPYDPRHPGNDPVEYANNVGQWLNMNPNQVYNHHDITTMAKVALGVVRFENGKFHWGPEAVKRGAELAFQVWAAGAPPKNLGEIIPYTMTNAPPGGLGNTGNSPVDAFSSAMRSFAPMTNQAPAPYMSGSIPPTPPFQTPPPSTSSTSTPALGAQGESIGMILAQPKPIASGRTITVSWTTLRMSDSQPCQVFINDTQFLAQGNEGSRTTPAGPSTGPEKFTLKCTDQKGNAFMQSDSVDVQ